MKLQAMVGLLFLAAVMEVVLATGNPALPCDESQCLLPNCRCASSTAIPNGFQKEDTPQIITISITGKFTERDYENIFKPTFENRENPNDYPIGITYFVSHTFTNYALMENVYANDRAEFAVTVSPSTGTTATEEELTTEINGQRTIMKLWGGIPENEVKGFRAPDLATSVNELKILHQSGFTYEASMTTAESHWPFTLDYESPICNSPATCPNNAYPGLWVVPVKELQQQEGNSASTCARLDDCTVLVTRDDWFQFFMNNFNSHYQSDNRSPLALHATSSWFTQSTTGRAALEDFLDVIATRNDVYIVTQAQLLAWVQHPEPIGSIREFEPWKYPARTPTCDYEDPRCDLTQTSVPFQSCSIPCPDTNPTVRNPEGNLPN